MVITAERFVARDDGGEAVDLATGARVRLFVEAQVSPAEVRRRIAVCDRLALLRHPLLLPLVDYGMCGRRWFEAHAALAPLRMTPTQARRAALHVVRFLRAMGVELTAEWAGRNVRTAVDSAGAASGRPIGVRLSERDSVEVVRTVLEASGPPGATTLAIRGADGAGLRTARLQIARMARLAGYLVLDTSVQAGREAAAAVNVRDRHVCALEWAARPGVLPYALTLAAPSGRRHVWIRFVRAPITARMPPRTVAEVQLEPMMIDELTSAIFADAELGPTPGEIRQAAVAAHGWPGLVVATLTGSRSGAGWVHETSPEYGVPSPITPEFGPADPAGRAGLARLERAVSAARTLAGRGRHARAARVLARCAPALAARGAVAQAAATACDLGELLLDRGHPVKAVKAFDQAREWGRDTPLAVRALVGSGRALLEQGQLIEAEAVFRTAAAADAHPQSQDPQVWLARTVWHRGDLDVAVQLLGDRCPWLLARIYLSAGRIDAAAQAARAIAGATPGVAHQGIAADECDMHVAAAYVHAAIGDAATAEQHLASAARAATASRNPAVRLSVAADRVACLERCGLTTAVQTRRRILRAAVRLPPLIGAYVRCALGEATEADRRILPPSRDTAHLTRHFQALVDAIHDAADEAAALQLIAADLHRTLGACSVVIRSARSNQAAAAVGRPWPGEAALAQPVLNGALAAPRDGATPDLVEPVRAAGAIVGSLAVRWVAGARPGWDRIREVLTLTAVAAAPLLRALKAHTAATDHGGSAEDLLGRGEAAMRLRDGIRRAAAAPFPVLIEGESGSGKELVARAIHERSLRRARRFCALNCAALTEDLLEAELFGHARGAFTGAVAERAGLFEEADQGTLFLDEVGELSVRAQAKLLRVLQEGEVRRVGENVSRRIDVRLVCATNRSLAHEVACERFRADLRFRLDVIRIAIPPLRERIDDLPWLAERIWAEAAARVGSRAVLGEDILAALARYHWPGNVRELQNVIASLVVQAPRRGRVPAALLPAHIANEAVRSSDGFDEARLDFERRYIRAALARANGRRSIAAEQLRLSRQGLAKVMKRLGLE